MYPFLSLKHVVIDPEVVRRLPRQLAYYHLVIPIAQDEDSVTVAMALTSNQQVIQLLETALGARVIPVRSPVDEIKNALFTVWEEAVQNKTPKLLAWNVSDGDGIKEYAQAFSEALSLQIVLSEGESTTVETLLTTIKDGEYQLIITPQTPDVETLLTRSPAPILLIQGQPRPFQHILFALRGHAPDQAALRYVMPLIQAQKSCVTLLGIAQLSSSGHVGGSGIAELLSGESIPGKHLSTCAEMLTTEGIEGKLKLRQGSLEREIAAEITENNYDLVVIAAEAFGGFVHQILKTIGTQTETNTSPILVIKSQAARLS